MWIYVVKSGSLEVNGSQFLLRDYNLQIQLQNENHTADCYRECYSTANVVFKNLFALQQLFQLSLEAKPFFNLVYKTVHAIFDEVIALNRIMQSLQKQLCVSGCTQENQKSFVSKSKSIVYFKKHVWLQNLFHSYVYSNDFT